MESKADLIFWIFSRGRDADIEIVSISIPWAVMEVVGLTVFLCWMGIPREEHNAKKVAREWEQEREFGGPTNMKSSIIWWAPWIWNLFSRIH